MVDVLSSPHFRDQIIQGLVRSVLAGNDGIKTVPERIKLIISHRLWAQERVVEQTGEVVAPFETFSAFVTAPIPEGLGINLKQLMRLCTDDKEALDLIDAALKEEARQGSRTDLLHNIQEVDLSLPSPTGTSTRAALRRLRKDRPDLHQKVVRGEISANKAAIEAGFRKERIQVPNHDMELAAKALIHKLSNSQLEELVKLLTTHLNI